MKKFLSSIVYAFVSAIIFANFAYAGDPLNSFTSYKEFGKRHHIMTEVFFENQPQSIMEHKIKKVYPETNKKMVRMESLGLNYTKGELYFLEFPNKDDGIYVSFNEFGLLDALIIEVNKNRNSAIMFTRNEVIGSIITLFLTTSSQLTQDLQNRPIRKLAIV